MGRPSAKEARDTRQEILDAALELFAEKGFFGTSMREIARAVGVRESAIYHHFANKDALLDALLQDAGESRLVRFEQATEDWNNTPPRELLLKLAKGMMTQWEQPREQKLWRMLMTEGFRLSESGRFQMDASFRKSRERLEQLFSDMAGAQKIKSVPAGLLSMEFMAPLLMVRNMIASPKAYHLPEGVSVWSVLQNHVNFFCDAIGA
jgi:AcrR family transcriptional regulator